MKRIPEPELMEDEEQVRAYAGADFENVHRNFITLFQATFGQNDLCGYVLDLGCGHGDITMRFARAYPKCIVHGIDGSEAMIRCGNGILKEAHDIQDRVVLIRGMLPASALPRRKYDIIISNSLLHHLAMPHTLYQCIELYAISGAPVFIMDLRRPQTTGEANALVQTFVAHEPEILKRDFYNSLLAAYTIEEVGEQLQGTELAHLSVKAVGDRHIVISGYMV
ncbi:MAG: SAM-dependent methyltransferase [Candidatus Brocadia carolinensis]|uniref:SAM-dependent methyltransferase n=1 Tax=Candidatus Brocadia carolinensis TaxID=1004156 RepID=A0A1V4ARU7_9BACT|nr:MAG: SAM-dependent methyltransferase [Candidatus Brocadia caroliniensis]